MSYTLEYSLRDHQDALQDTLLDWSKDDHDIYIVSDEGHKIFTQKILLYFYSNTLGKILDSLPPSTSIPGISVSASSSSVSNLMKILTTGRAASNNKDTLVNVKEAAKALGINLGNCSLEAKKKPGTTVLQKLLPKTEATVSPKTEATVSPANLSVFRNREPSIAGMAKWNTVIIAKNKVTQIPANFNSKNVISEETKVDDENEIDEVKLPCEYCSKVFTGKRNLRRHKQRKHQIGSKIKKGSLEISTVKIEKPEDEDNASEFQCQQCDEGFKSERKLSKHSRKHTNRFTCDQCEKTFVNSSSLKNHSNIHLAEKPFKCEVCNKEFTQAGNLKTHRIKHHNLTDTQADSSAVAFTPEVEETDDKDATGDSSEKVTADHCGYCEEQFDDIAELNSHMVLMHSIQKMIESSE
eukprot:GFUD01027717.1.p1 GENE.GFUD01027717.1~~GFUD01027717.1.p1  ORF type:complete len:410 (-),score=93.53 GFUD01027717.1:38-1267(-)